MSKMNESLPIYLDYNASTPVHPKVVDEMIPYLKGFFGNPSSGHIYGTSSKQAIVVARERVAKMLNCSADEIIFTSGGTECNNMAIRGTYHTLRKKSKKLHNHMITTTVEHPSVCEVAKYLSDEYGVEVTYLNVDKYGMIDVKELENAIRDTTFIVSVMHSNNVVGTIQPIAEIAEICKKKGVVFHSDSVQSIGKTPVDVKALGVNMCTVCSHKFYGPKGVGALYVQKGIELRRLIHGAPHENGLRAGTENVLEIVGLGKACELVHVDLEQRMKHMREMRDRLLLELTKRLGNNYVVVNGHPEKRLCNTLSASFPGLKANEILEGIQSRVAASAGAACHSGEVKMSGVLSAMNLPVNIGMGTLRLSVGILTTKEEILEAAKVISNTVLKLKK